MRSIRWAVIGVGRFGLIHARVLATLPGVELAGLVNRNSEKLAQAAAAFPGVRQTEDYREILADPSVEAVSIVTHWREHASIALHALEAGKHVLLEKPMAATAAECQQLLAAASQSRGYLMVGHICRFDPRVTLARQAIAAGRIGRIVSLHAKRNLPVAPGSLRLDKISPLMGDGIHDADLMMWFLGQAPTRVYARQVRVHAFHYPDLAWAMLEFGTNAIGVIETVWCLPPNVSTTIDARLEVVGTAGQLVIDAAHTGLAILDPHGWKQPDTMYWPVQMGTPFGALAAEISYFADCIRRQQPPEAMPLTDAARAVAVMQLAEQSATLGQPLDVRLD